MSPIPDPVAAGVTTPTGTVALEVPLRTAEVHRARRFSFSTQLKELTHRVGQRPIRLDELAAVFQGRASNVLLILLALPFLTPVPLPLLSIPFGIIIALSGLCMALRRKPWLPPRLADKQLPARRAHPHLVRSGTHHRLAGTPGQAPMDLPRAPAVVPTGEWDVYCRRRKSAFAAAAHSFQQSVSRHCGGFAGARRTAKGRPVLCRRLPRPAAFDHLPRRTGLRWCGNLQPILSPNIAVKSTCKRIATNTIPFSRSLTG